MENNMSNIALVMRSSYCHDSKDTVWIPYKSYSDRGRAIKATNRINEVHEFEKYKIYIIKHSK